MPKWLRAVVVLLWAGLMVSQVMRTRAAVDADLAFAATRLREDAPAVVAEEWFGIYRANEKVGYASHRREPIDGGFRVVDRAVVKLAVMGAPRLVRTDVHAETDRRFALRRFDFAMRSGPIELRVTGVAREKAIDVEIATGGGPPRKMTLPVAEPPVLPQTLHAVLAREKLVTGSVYRYTLLDPTTGLPSTVTLTVGARTPVELPEGPRDAYLVTQEHRGSKFTLWVDPTGEVVREEGPLGLVLVRELPSRAVAGTLSASGLDLGAAAAIAPSEKLAAPRAIRRLELKIGGVPADFAIAFPPRQRLDGDRLTIESEGEGASDAAAPALPITDASFADDLAPTAFLQSDAKEIREQAAAIVGGERDAARAARKILEWTNREVAKVPSASWPSALDVLRTRQGDCNEHAVLFAALARAAGLPARIAAGVVYVSGEEGLADAFYYHAWNEVWIGRWVTVDAVFGQLPADATHVKLVSGSPERHADLLPLLGKVTLEIEGQSRG